MAEWIERLISSVTPQSDKPVIAIDPEGLLLFPEVGKRIGQQGYTVILTKPGIQGRIAFELNAREKTSVILVVQGIYKPLPDIRQEAVVVTISYATLFPFLDAKALSGLSYNSLCTLEGIRPYEQLGFDGTVRFLLENLYNVDLDALKKFQTRERVLAILLKVLIHPDVPNIPIINLLKQIARPFWGERSEKMVLREKLLEYIREQWAIKDTPVTEILFTDPLLSTAIHSLIVSGLIEMQPEGHIDIKEGREPINLAVRFNEIRAYILERIPAIQNQQNDWFELSSLLGEIGVLVYKLNDVSVTTQYTELLTRLNERFQGFVSSCYSSLYSLSGTRYPVTITKVLDYMRAQAAPQKALFVIDGMNLWQWYMLKEALAVIDLHFRDTPSFAWIPSITAWSRQALFKGGKPDLSADNLKEAKLFSEYWIKKGFQPYQVAFDSFAAGRETTLPGKDIEIAGIVCDDLDELMHGSLMGNRQLYVDTKTWIQSSGIVQFLENLAKRGFSIYITTDHGNIEAKAGKGLSLSIRNLSRSRSKRHIQFVDNETARKFVQDHGELNIRALDSSVYLTDDSAFISTGTVVTHGGSHIMELMIPMGVLQV